MLFHEIYGSYFHVVAEILSEAVEHQLTGTRLNELVREKAFAESGLTIPVSLRKSWSLLREDLSTPLHSSPSMPLTTLQKRWLKTLLQDGRIRLFAPNLAGLEDVDPLFNWNDVVYFDQYLDGDPYEDVRYIENFRTIMTAIHEHRNMEVAYYGTADRSQTSHCVPDHMEYSEKDDKFRVIVHKNRRLCTLNMARVESCKLLEPAKEREFVPIKPHPHVLTFRLRDERDALNRVLLHFSHFEKESVQLSDREYEVTLSYDPMDETELLIRILSFGPMVQVVAPKRFIRLIQARLRKQIQRNGSGSSIDHPF